MVRRSYPGIRPETAVQHFDRVRPAMDELTAMMLKVRPFSPDYLILLAAHDAVATAGRHFTKNPNLFGSTSPSA